MEEDRLGADSVKFRPVILVGNDHVVQNLFGDIGTPHGFGKGHGLPELLVTVLAPGIHDQFFYCDLLFHQEELFAAWEAAMEEQESYEQSQTEE